MFNPLTTPLWRGSVFINVEMQTVLKSLKCYESDFLIIFTPKCKVVSNLISIINIQDVR